jgi:hypothetical protein
MRSILSVGFVITLAACGSNKGGGGDTDSGNPPDACVGLECQVVNCQAMGQSPTTLSGTVFAPNGTLPLYGITVYVPLSDPGTPSDMLECDRCSSSLPGGSVAQATSGEDGKFTLMNVPVGDNIPIVLKSGKWQRKITIPRVEQCVDTPLVAADTSLPKNSAEGNIPEIAITTGSADSLECLIRRLGIADSEINKTGTTGRIHLYQGNGTNSFKTGFAGGSGAIPTATTFWNNVDNLKGYDIVILSCEGAQNVNTKPQPALDAMKAYADAGGRVFASHWHNIWIGGNFQGNGAVRPAVWDSVSTWDAADGNPGNPVKIDEVGNPKGTAFANWMVNVMGSTTRGDIQLIDNTKKMTARVLDQSKAERWVYSATSGAPQNFQFTTPLETTPDNRCGKVVFSDMHVSGGPAGPGGAAYPDSCGGTLTLSPQEKALAFMFFDIASCVGPIF